MVTNMDEIGKVKLDYSKYPGEDLYSDGETEDVLLDIVKKTPPSEFARIIEESRSWPVLYHLSPLRENIVDWVPMRKSHKVLEVGSGCGAITGALARKAGSVTCVELSKKRSLINAYRHKECDNITIHVGNFKDIEPDLPEDFDYICLIGVFEYGISYIGGSRPYVDFLRLLLPHLKHGGRLLIAIENQYGLKYFAGCREDHLGTYFSGIENYSAGDGVRTFSRKRLERIFRSCKVPEYHFYYPYPDYKFMKALYSDAYLPEKGTLSDNICNFDRDRMLLFDEKSAFDGLVEDGLFPVFSNSYLAVLGVGFDMKYVKYSNDRASEFAIRTEILRDRIGNTVVRKYPLNEAAREHVRNIEAAYEELEEKYRGGSLEVNCCQLMEEGESLYAQFEFVQGVSLSELMDECLKKCDLDAFYKYFKEYVERIGYNSEYPVADFDLTFANILVNQENWTLIDYEWTFGKPISTQELAYRAVYCYILEDEKRNLLNPGRVMKELGITEEEAEKYREQEHDFQKFVTGDRLALAEIRNRIGHRVVTPQKWLDKYQGSEQTERVQIYEDRGKGYAEGESYFVPEAYKNENLIEMELSVDKEVRTFRIDPAFDACVVRIQELTFNGKPVSLKKKKLIQANGKVIGPGAYVFPTQDPNINIAVKKLKRGVENTLRIRMEVVRLPLAMAQGMAVK